MVGENHTDLFDKSVIFTIDILLNINQICFKTYSLMINFNKTRMYWIPLTIIDCSKINQGTEYD